MAKPDRRHPANAPGAWFVDDTCINCDASRQCAPGLLVERDGQSVFARQPETEAELRDATRAMIICPSASIGMMGEKPLTGDVFPVELDPGVYLCGFNSPRSYGANSYFVTRPSGNFLVDSPRYVVNLVKKLEALGGIRDILLTHRDDVADADRYAAHFGARVFIHESDQAAAPYATDILRGLDPVPIHPGLRAIPVPGHTRGSVMYLLEDTYLFTGDSLYYSRMLDGLCAFRRVCWYSWPEQMRSLARVRDEVRFEWVLAGHGDRRHDSAENMRAGLARLIERMEAEDPALENAPSGIAW